MCTRYRYSRWLLLLGSTIDAATVWHNGSEGRNETDTSLVLLSGAATLVSPISSATRANNATQQPITGSGLEYASECNSAKLEWYFNRGSSLVSTTTFQTSTPDVLYERSTWFTTTTSLAPGATPYTLCDGYTRIDGTTNFSTSVYSILSTTISTFETETEVYANVTAPPCVIQSSDCAYLNSSYWQASTAYSEWYWDSITAHISSQPFTAQPPPSPSEGTAPMCGTPPPIRPASTSLIPAVCVVNTAHVQLLYWPVTTASNCSLCDMAHCATRTPTPTIPGSPNTIVTFDTTLTSPTVYIAFEGELIGGSEGQSFSDIKRFLVPQSSTAISSYCGKIGGGIDGPPQPFNYAHLNGAVPASAYRCQPRCFSNPLGVAEYTTTYTTGGKVTTATSVTWSDYATENLCSTIWNDYDPMLSIPAELSTMLFSEGSSGCNFTAMPEAVLFDPPIALTQADHAEKPTAPAGNPAEPTPDPPSPTAQPGSTPDTTLPSPTGDLPPQQASPTGSSSSPTGGDDRDPSKPDDGSPPPGAGSDQANAPQTTSRNIGGIIASAIGMTPVQNDPPIPSAPANALNPLPQSPGAGTALGGDPAHEGATSAGASSAQIAPELAVLTGTDGQEVTALHLPAASVVLVGSATLAVGQTLNLPAIVTIVAQSSGVIVDGSFQAFSDAAAAPVPSIGAVVEGSEGQIFTIGSLSDGHIVVGTATLDAGVSTSVSGIGNVAVESNGVVIDGTTHAYSSIPGSQASSNPAVITAGSTAFTVGGDGRFTIAPGQVLTPGGEVTVSGTTYSLGPQGSVAVVNGVSQTVAVSSAGRDPADATTRSRTITGPDAIGSPTQPFQSIEFSSAARSKRQSQLSMTLLFFAMHLLMA